MVIWHGYFKQHTRGAKTFLDKGQYMFLNFLWHSQRLQLQTHAYRNENAVSLLPSCAQISKCERSQGVISYNLTSSGMLYIQSSLIHHT